MKKIRYFHSLMFVTCIILSLLILGSCKHDHKVVKGYPDIAYKITVRLEMPDTVPFVLQYAMFKDDPVVMYKKKVREMLSYIRENRHKNDYSGYWDMIFNDIQGDQMAMISSHPDDIHVLGGNFTIKQAWIVTKISWLKKEPVCWAVQAQLAGDSAMVVLNKDNMLNLKSMFDEVLR